MLPKNHLVMGEMRKASLGWTTDTDGTQTIHTKVEGIDQAKILILQELYYICPLTRTVGILDTGLPHKQAAGLLKAPPIKPEQAAAISEKLASLTTPELLPAMLPMRELLIQPIPHLRLCESIIQPVVNDWRRHQSGAAVSVASIALSFNYEGKYLTSNDTMQEIRCFKDGEVLITPRNHVIEKDTIKLLQNFGFTMKLEDVSCYYDMSRSDHLNLTIGEAKQNFHKDSNIQKRWESFMQGGLPHFREQGWQISIEQNFPYNIIYADDEWYAEIEEGSGIDWFGVELGVTLDGKRLNLVPILLSLLKKDNDIFEIIKNLPKDKPFLVSMEDGRRIALPSERAKILLTTMQYLFSFHSNMDEEGRLRMQGLDAALIAEIEAAANSLNMRWFGGEKVRNLGKRLREFTSVSNIVVPQTFHGELRPYQQEGLNWLQFLREYNLAGILADDMGLGKTVQLLAHIASEKATAKHPFLVIAPTSLMANWKSEAKRFVPGLKVLTLHGSARKIHFKDIKKYDLVLTTYPLLLRDKDILIAHEYHTIILDEAQTIKNAKAKVTQIVNQLKASHRLCMTGTPIENHLGELWSLFHFLLPGYLGTYKQFNSLFRTPIEKAGDVKSSEALSMRIKPFVLRRTKQEVVTELPPKTEIIRMIELEGVQRDLYETIRASMHEKIQEEIAARGVEKSHIIILDALLKLRQACCDPALLKIGTPINQSAKRDELMTMLTAMLAEGRKILLFLQFTSMLALIEKQLDKEKIPYVILTGQTKDRETPIRQFQEGEVSLFLISLKAVEVLA
jgi:SNF2 family DNA or RNA helicase